MVSYYHMTYTLTRTSIALDGAEGRGLRSARTTGKRIHLAAGRGSVAAFSPHRPAARLACRLHDRSGRDGCGRAGGDAQREGLREIRAVRNEAARGGND